MDVFDPILLKPGMMIDITEFYFLMLLKEIWTMIQGYRNTRKHKLLHQFGMLMRLVALTNLLFIMLNKKFNHMKPAAAEEIVTWAG